MRLRPEMLAFFLKGSYKTIKIHRKKKKFKTAQCTERKRGILRVPTSADIHPGRTASPSPRQLGCGVAGRSLTLA